MSDLAAGTIFAQAPTDAPASSFVADTTGGVPRDLGSIFGPDGLNLDSSRPDLVGGITQIVAGISRAVGVTSPVSTTGVTPHPTAISHSTLLFLGVGGVILWLLVSHSRS